MSYSVIHTDLELKSLVYNDQHITIYCHFDKDGTPVNVDNAQFTLWKNGKELGLSEYDLLRPLQKDNTVEVGKYIVTFLSEGLTAGTYSAKMVGSYAGSDITVTETLTLFEQPRVQYLIDVLKSLLNGKYNLDIPNKYVTFDPTKKLWQDGELFVALKQGVERINSVNPPTDWTLDDVPTVHYTMVQAQILCLVEKSTLDAINYFDISVPYRVQMYRGDKFLDVGRFLEQQFQSLAAWKLTYYINNEIGDGAIAITMKRTPIRLVRPISDNMYFHSTAW